MEYLSNLDVFIEAFINKKDHPIENKHIYFFRNNKLYQKYEEEDYFFNQLTLDTYEINGKFLITYFYHRGCSTSTIYDMNDKYKKVYEKRYGHYCDYFFIKDKYIILPYDVEYYENPIF